jgi:catechol 2,3-dioxygenase-like lactoylglutathione lyase family enzyme
MAEGQLRAFAAIFPVSDVARSIAFFIDMLGFDEEFKYGDPLDYAIVDRDAVSLHLMRVTNDLPMIGRSSIYVFVADVDALHEEISGHGCTIEVAPQDFPYGMREMSVRDPDGNRVTFGQEVTAAA